MADAAPVAPEQRPRCVVCVLGMHRSGTSCLAGSLHRQGLYMGEVTPPRPGNRRGHFENFDVMHLQDELLESSDGAWWGPPETVAWKPEHYEEARTILARHGGRPVWGFKDPRTLLTLEGWRALVPDLELVGIFRHPLRVARSLNSRGGMRLEKGLELWEDYNERLAALHAEAPFPVVCFDDEARVLEEKLRRAGEMLDLRDEPEEPFFTDELRTEPAEGAELPPQVEALYERLRAIAL
jgi:hypothetical protein